MPLITTLRDLRPSDRQVGAKARTLARLARLDLPVPPAVVLRHAAWLAYLEACAATALWGAFVAQPNEERATPLRSLLATQPLPASLLAALRDALVRDVDPVALTTLPAAPGAERLYAVRSAFGVEDGAGRSFAGIFASRLGVGVTDLDGAVRTVWASALGEPAIAYYQESGAASALSVLVQAIPPLDCAGVLLTQAPDNDEALLVNAVWGLAEPLAQGRVRPDRWLLARAGGRVLKHEAGERAVAAWPVPGGLAERPLAAHAPPPLSLTQLDSLRRLGLQIEHVLRGPQDIEWTHNGQRFWVVQVRPITTGTRLGKK